MKVTGLSPRPLIFSYSLPALRIPMLRELGKLGELGELGIGNLLAGRECAIRCNVNHGIQSVNNVTNQLLLELVELSV